MTQQELCDRTNIVDQHIPSAFWPTVPRLVLWSAFNAGMARAGVGLVAKLATTTGWDELQTPEMPHLLATPVVRAELFLLW